MFLDNIVYGSYKTKLIDAAVDSGRGGTGRIAWANCRKGRCCFPTRLLLLFQSGRNEH